MQLVGVEIDGFRRFAESTNVRLLERLIALVGPNEAGKTSFLKALEEINEFEEIPDRNLTRRLEVPTTISATYVLEESDWKALKTIEGGEDINRCTLTKRENGNFEVHLDPKPEHDYKPRRKAREKLVEVKESPIVTDTVSGKAQRKRTSSIESVEKILGREEDFLGQSRIKEIRDLASTFIEIAENNDSEKFDDGAARAMGSLLEDLVEHEEDCAPKLAKDKLLHRRPQFLLFEEEDRDLRESYNLQELGTNPPKALENLARLADLDLDTLRKAAIEENIPHRTDLLERANKKLKKEFSKAWVREEVVPVLSMDGTVLHLLVRTPDEENLSRIDERSDGLRWFVALLSFLSQKDMDSKPILLVDEAESHLSYDAQANLIEVLETQTVAQKVIYTTHSAGCLPSDLGTGIRPVIPLEGERSDIRNGFWAEGPGFKPLMLAMGLSPLAFSVARNALIAEGPSETILLPTLIRQAIDESVLEYQVAPGASSVGSNKLPELLSETGQAAIILDGDEAGEKMKSTLVDAGATEDRIRTYKDIAGEAFVFEDLIEKEVFVEAFNEELETWQDPDELLTTEDLPETGRPAAVDEWCNQQGLSKVNKPTLCQRLAEKASQDVTVIDSDRENILRDIHEWAKEHYVLP